MEYTRAAGTLAFIGMIGLALASCAAGGGAPGAQAPAPLMTQADCVDLKGITVAGGLVHTGQLRRASDAGNRHGDFCQVNGSIAPLDAMAPPILFQVNLPVRWNGKSIQYGGGGFNGSLVTGLEPLNFAPAGRPTPLALGYVTLGDDSGHAGSITDARFAANDEALANYGRLSIKKTQDVARALIQRLYGARRPDKSYFIGSSTGGRDALSAVQHWPDDYDAIVINRPALNYTGLRLSNIQLGRSVFLNNGQGWLNPAKTRLLLERVMASCDILDGLADGIIGALDQCKARSAILLEGLRCPAGGEGGDTCLSDAQLATVRTMAAPLPLASPLTPYGGYNILAGMVFGPPYAGSRHFGKGPVAPAAPSFTAVSSGAGANAPAAYVTGDQWMKYFITRDSAFDSLGLDPLALGNWQQRIAQVAELSDATGSMAHFFAKGGKIIWTHGAADEVVSTDSSIDFFRTLQARHGIDLVERSVRFYLIYGNGHGETGPFVPSFDSLAMLSAWVEQGVDPGESVVVRNTRAKAASDTSSAHAAQRPLCRYPAYPRYRGGGADPRLAGSFACAR